MSVMQRTREALALGIDNPPAISAETGIPTEKISKALNNLVSRKQAHRTGWMPKRGSAQAFGTYALGARKLTRPVASVWELGTIEDGNALPIQG